MKIIPRKPTSESNWWVGEVHYCKNFYLCRTVFQLELADKPKLRHSSGDWQHMPAEYIWSVNCPRCNTETYVRVEEV